MKKNQKVNDIARQLVESGFTLARYEKLQDERKRRLAFFEERGIPVLIDAEKRLIEFGEEISLAMTEIILNKMLKQKHGIVDHHNT